MIPQYFIVKECLQILHERFLAPIDKLQIEVQLIKLKKVFLSDTFVYEVKCEAASENNFKALLDDIKDCEGRPVTEIVHNLVQLVKVLTDCENEENDKDLK